MSIARYLSKLGALLGSDGKVPASALATGAVTADAVGANTITLAKLARVGTAGHVLTSNGAGSDPSYQALPAGGVTSLTAGNGIGVSASTGAVTVSAACPTSLSIGSYAWGFRLGNTSTVSNTNYTGGTGTGQVQGMFAYMGSCNMYLGTNSAALSGTWKYMGTTTIAAGQGTGGLFCRVA